MLDSNKPGVLSISTDIEIPSGDELQTGEEALVQLLLRTRSFGDSQSGLGSAGEHCEANQSWIVSHHASRWPSLLKQTPVACGEDPDALLGLGLELTIEEVP